MKIIPTARNRKTNHKRKRFKFPEYTERDVKLMADYFNGENHL